MIIDSVNRQAAQEQDEGVPRYRQDQGWREEGQEISGCTMMMITNVAVDAEWRIPLNRAAWFVALVGSESLQALTCIAMEA
jgi:hypothetical protein